MKKIQPIFADISRLLDRTTSEKHMGELRSSIKESVIQLITEYKDIPLDIRKGQDWFICIHILDSVCPHIIKMLTRPDSNGSFLVYSYTKIGDETLMFESTCIMAESEIGETNTNIKDAISVFAEKVSIIYSGFITYFAKCMKEDPLMTTIYKNIPIEINIEDNFYTTDETEEIDIEDFDEFLSFVRWLDDDDNDCYGKMKFHYKIGSGKESIVIDYETIVSKVIIPGPINYKGLIVKKISSNEDKPTTLLLSFEEMANYLREGYKQFNRMKETIINSREQAIISFKGYMKKGE